MGENIGAIAAITLAAEIVTTSYARTKIAETVKMTPMKKIRLSQTILLTNIVINPRSLLKNHKLQHQQNWK